MESPPRRRHREVTLRSLDVEVTREVSIGAFARQQRRKRVWMGLFGLGLVVSAVVVYVFVTGVGESDVRETYVRCANCGFEGELTVEVGRVLPIACSKCKQGNCRELWECRACRHRFSPPRFSGIIRCPKCESDQVGAATAASASRPADG